MIVKVELEHWDVELIVETFEDKLEALKARELQLDLDTNSGSYEYARNVGEQYELEQLLKKLTKPLCECNCGRCH